MTLHNQRDFVFFRHHRYVFEQDERGREVKATLQELGPRFTLKLKSLQPGSPCKSAAALLLLLPQLATPAPLPARHPGPPRDARPRAWAAPRTPEPRPGRSAHSGSTECCQRPVPAPLTLRLLTR